MGLLSKGTPLSWEQSKRYHDYVKRHGIVQFLNIYRLMSRRENDIFLWGDEVEHQLVQVDPLTNTASLSLRAPDILLQLEQMQSSSHHHWNAHFVPEYGRHMIEATPARPYGGYTADLRMVEANMRLRRQLVQELLNPNEFIMTITAFPLLGVGQYALPSSSPHGPIAQSLYVSDSIIGPHPRFATLSRNIRIRRGSKVCIRVPLYQDRNTRQSMERQLRLRDAAVREIRQERKLKETGAVPSSPAVASASSPPSPSSPPAAFQPPTSPSTAHLPLSPVGSWPLVTSATNLSESGDEVFPPIPDCSCLPPINELEEIHMDAMAFGMGQCCLQVTFQTRSINEARHLYDHLAVLSPIMLALSAATPFHRGRIADTDVRWTVISQAVDDRTVKERGEEDLSAVELERRASIADYEKPLPQSHAEPPSPPAAASRRPQRLHKSRYDSISCFLSLESDLNPAYNDVPCEQDAQSYDALIAAGIDPLLATHVSHLFVRDPLVIYDESLVQDDEKSSDHFENLQSTNWQTVRFKPPPPSLPGQPVMGWRVEFRTMEVQLTDFENAAFTVFVALISRAILYFNLNLYLPISRVDDNLSRAHRRDAINTQRFHWRKVVKNCPPEDSEAGSSSNSSGSSPCGGFSSSDEPEWEEMSLGEIMLGKESCQYPGLIPLVRTYLDMIQCDAQTLEVVNRYLELLSLRACGQLLTAASWLRKFVSVHPDYQHDSQLRQSVVADLMRSIEQIQSGKIEVTQLLGKLRTAATEERKEKERKDGDEDDAQAGGKVELKGAPALLDLEDAVCCEKFREYLKRHSNDIGSQHTRQDPQHR